MIKKACIFLQDIISFQIKMDIQLSSRSSDNEHGFGMDQESPIEKIDLFNQMLDLSISDKNQHREYHIKSARKHQKKNDFRKILNTSSSNERLFPIQLKRDSSLEHLFRNRNFYQTENSLDEQSFRKSFKKREQSFSVEHTIRDSSSSISQHSDSRSFRHILPAQYRDEEPVETQQKKIGCNCKRSKCLKLYCQCFQRQLFCNQNCNCHDCGNTPENSQKHRKAIIQALGRNAHGFENERQESMIQKERDRDSFSLGIELNSVKKGCKCKKTHCIKNYCECYHRGVVCGIFCRCEDCKNTIYHQQKNK